ncbi:MAG: T9SS type A sorting domain-containing protein [Flavobacteriales bacterium]|nr:T9SS type A sorting domain-containing protein [Flavobacteriales bacterium]
MRPLFIIALVCTVISSANAQQVATAEYFFDTDPGVGNGTPVPGFTAADSVDVSFTVSTVGLAPGGHNLFIRYKDAQGKWGIYEGRSFYVDAGVAPQQNAPLVAQAEYFFDTDPGVGNGTALPSFTANDTVDLTSNISAAGLSIGIHQLFIRYKDAAGKWGIYEGREFEVVDCQFPLVAVSVSGAACDGAEVMLSDLSTQVEPGATYAWDVDNDGVVDYTTVGDVMHTFPGPGTYTVELMVENTDVCKDSTTIEVTVNPVYDEVVNVTICSGSDYTFPDGTEQTNITQDVVQVSTLTSSLNCDSTVTTNITVGADFQTAETASVCAGGSFTFPDGTTQTDITQQVVYTSTLQATTSSCDSLVTTTVEVITVDTAVTVNGADLVANATNADYQWLDCDNGFSTITGADAAVFMPMGNGNYAVEVTQQGCADTSSCYNVFTVGLESLTEAATVTVYPNPTNGQLYVSYPGNDQPSYMLVDASGRMLLNGVLPASGALNLSDVSDGIYQLVINTDEARHVQQIVILKQ